MKPINVLAVVALLLLLAGLARADGEIVRPRQVLAGGASDTIATGAIHIAATLGQPVVGPVSASAEIALGQGFWYAGVAPRRVYLPLLRKS
jgi:hypothetical protein